MKRLFFDIGAHKGNDTAFYLEHGWKVVAVEAHPTLASLSDERFHMQLGDARVIHRAITPTGKPAKLFVSDKGVKGETHSIYPHRVKGCEQLGYTVEGTTIGYLLKTYGVPDYMKVDIEGADVIAIRQLHSWLASASGKGYRAPPYLSVELCPNHPEETLEIFSHLAYMGYDLFSIEEQHWDTTIDVDQVEHTLPINAAAGLWFMHMVAAARAEGVWFDLHTKHSTADDHTEVTSGVTLGAIRRRSPGCPTAPKDSPKRGLAGFAQDVKRSYDKAP